jgi:hypothetical protein
MSLKVVVVLFGLLSLPISFFLTYTMLSALHVDRLVWFLFWINVPRAIVISILQDAIRSAKK